MIRITRKFTGFPGTTRGYKSDFVDGEVVCELVRLDIGGHASPTRVVWKIVDVQISNAEKTLFDTNPAWRARFVDWLKAIHGIAISEALFEIHTRTQQKKGRFHEESSRRT